MSATILFFGHGAPLHHPALAGLATHDITRRQFAPSVTSQIASWIEPFMDPFVRSFLFGLERRAFDEAAVIVLWRLGPGALHAYRYAMEFRRLGLLPDGPPLVLWNQVSAGGPAQQSFNAKATLAMLAALPEPHGAIPDAPQRPILATGPGPRLALAGEPLGNTVLHDALAERGTIVLDLQATPGPVAGLDAQLRAQRIDTLYWQVDLHDDLHGWQMPRVREACQSAGTLFIDLGFLPRWPSPDDLTTVLP